MEEQVLGIVQRIVYQNSETGYAVAHLLTPEGELITVVGCIPCAAPGEQLEAEGVWETHPQHGRQFRARETLRQLPEEAADILRFLSSGVCPGVGPSTARLLVERFGDRTLEVLEQAPEALSSVPGLSPRRGQAASAAFRQQMGLRRLVAFLVQHRLPAGIAVTLLRRYGEEALPLLRRNPYVLCQEEVDFSAADQLALSIGLAPLGRERLEAAVRHELRHNQRNGHVFLPRDKLLSATVQMLDCPREPVEEALASLLDRGELVTLSLANVQAVYLPELFEAESDVCRLLPLLSGSRQAKPRLLKKFLSRMEREQGITYAPLQRQAVELAGSEPVLLLTGGPGTGKTTTLRGIAALFSDMGLRLALAAPTGRAAQRLSQLTGQEAQTIHRMLGMTWSSETRAVAFQKNEREPLEAQAVIVDEMSMVDLPLFAALLRALRPGSRLILSGDADQLPSVGAGNVFSDLIRSRRLPVISLREIFRQAEASAIVRNAHRINAGEPPQTEPGGDLFFLSRREEARAVHTIVELCSVRLPGKLGIPPEQIQVLSPTRKGPCGTESLNRLLQQALNPPSREKAEIHWGQQIFRVGDRIMQNRNDYDVLWSRRDGTAGCGIFNGDVGRVTAIHPGGETLTVDFEGRQAVYTPEMLRELELCYAQTVHKAQGSEYRCVVFAAVPAAPMLMVRGVLYTAMTRARELLVMVGEEAVLRAMTANDRRQKRYSGLKWRLARAWDTPPPVQGAGQERGARDGTAI